MKFTMYVNEHANIIRRAEVLVNNLKAATIKIEALIASVKGSWTPFGTGWQDTFAARLKEEVEQWEAK